MHAPGHRACAWGRALCNACPHDCPDTCALQVTVQGGRVVRVAGDPDHPPTHGALCTKVSRYPERSYHPDRVLQPLRASAPRAAAVSSPWAGTRRWTTSPARLQAIAARDPQAILPYSYAGTMGLVQGEGMAARFFHRLGASRLDRTICANAGGDALIATYGGQGRHAPGALRREPADPDLGQQLDHLQPALLDLRAAGQARGAKLICIDPRRSETAEKCHQHIALLPGTDGALALGLMHELIVHDWLDHDYIERHVDGWPALRERALQWPPERAAATCGISADEVRGWRATTARTAPAAIRLNYGMQRVRGGGNAVRLIAMLPCLVGAWRHRAGGLLLSASGWFKPCATTPRCSGPTCWPAAAAHVNMSTIGDDLLREASPAFGPRDRGAGGLQQQPGGGGARQPPRWSGFAREDLFTVVLEHFLTDTADHADYRAAGHHAARALGRAHHLRPHLRAGERAGDRAAGAGALNTQIFRALAARMGFDEPCFSDSDEAWPAPAFKPEVVDFDTLLRARLGQAAGARGALRRGRLPHAERQGAGRRAGPGRARLRAQPRMRRPRPNWRTLPAGDDLAAGAALPQLHLRQREEPARDRGRAAAGDPPGRCRRARHRRGQVVRCSTTAALPLQGRGERTRAAGRGQRPGRVVAQVRAWTAPTSTS
jgi:hypothetical protein